MVQHQPKITMDLIAKTAVLSDASDYGPLSQDPGDIQVMLINQ